MRRLGELPVTSGAGCCNVGLLPISSQPWGRDREFCWTGGADEPGGVPYISPGSASECSAALCLQHRAQQPQVAII
jgi:hypothetical protein